MPWVSLDALEVAAARQELRQDLPDGPSHQREACIVMRALLARAFALHSSPQNSSPQILLERIRVAWRTAEEVAAELSESSELS